jgi:hypothetical protein
MDKEQKTELEEESPDVNDKKPEVKKQYRSLLNK